MSPKLIGSVFGTLFQPFDAAKTTVFPMIPPSIVVSLCAASSLAKTSKNHAFQPLKSISGPPRRPNIELKPSIFANLLGLKPIEIDIKLRLRKNSKKAKDLETAPLQPGGRPLGQNPSRWVFSHIFLKNKRLVQSRSILA